MTEPAKHITLTVGFDVDQITDTLHFEFSSPDHAQPNPATGLYASEIYLGEGEVFHLHIKGGGTRGRFRTFKVVDCCLVTRPKVVAAGPGEVTLHAPPSPFVQCVGATYRFAPDFSSEAVEHEHEGKIHRVVTQRWKHSLDVAHSPGQWKLSLILTVLIEGGASGQQEVRVFSFDPEGQVGPGSGWDQDPK